MLSWLFVVAVFALSTPAWAAKKKPKPGKKNNAKSAKPANRTKALAILKSLRPIPVKTRLLNLSQYKLSPRSDLNHPQQSLASFYKIARRNNLDLKILRQRIIQAELLRVKAWSAFLPTASITGLYRRNNIEQKFDPAAGMKSLVDNIPEPFKSQFAAGLKDSKPVVVQPLDLFSLSATAQIGIAFQAIPMIQSAYTSVKQIGETARQTRREVMFAVARAYYGALLSDGLVRISRQSWKNALSRLKTEQARYQAGVVPAINVTRAQLDLIKAQQSVLKAENSLRQIKSTLGLLLNRPNLRFRPVRPPSPGLPSGSSGNWLSDAKRKRAEIKAARYALKAAQQQLTASWLAFLPTFAIQFNYSNSNNAGIAGVAETWNLNFIANLNIFDRGSRFIAIRENSSKVKQAELSKIKALRNVSNDVSNASRDLQNAKITVKVAQKQLQLARSTYKLTQARYSTGVATPVEVSDSFTLLNSAEISALSESLNYDLAILNLQRVIGSFRP
jgi:outer membrane protein TolC